MGPRRGPGHDPGARLGDLVEYEELEPTHFGRVGAQVAGQVVRQRLREAERETLFDEFAHREGEIITGSVGRVEPSGIILDLGKAEAILRTTDQSATEHYRIGQHVKAYVLEVRRTTRGPLIYVSRTHKNFLRRLFELEVPEISAGTVEIKAIAREAGSRSKVAVSSRQDGLDAVGATVGQRGGRVQAVVAELGGEKIDVIPWSEEAATFVANALSPAQVVGRRHRRAEPHRVGDGARADALARDRPRGPERPPRCQADRLAHRHPLRPGGTARRGRHAGAAGRGHRGAGRGHRGVRDRGRRGRSPPEAPEAEARPRAGSRRRPRPTPREAPRRRRDAAEAAPSPPPRTRRAAAAAEAPAAADAPAVSPEASDAPAAKPKRTRRTKTAEPTDEAAATATAKPASRAKA